VQVQSALEMFQQSLVGSCYFFMCFFANNQYRILVEESSTGSDNLEEVFESNLKRIGKMVAILDTWHQPAYLTRIWTVYEQFVASMIEIEATASSVLGRSKIKDMYRHTGIPTCLLFIIFVICCI